MFQIQYLIKWLNYDEKENSWEPVENLNCAELVEQFERVHKKEDKKEKSKEKQTNEKDGRHEEKPKKKNEKKTMDTTSEEDGGHHEDKTTGKNEKKTTETVNIYNHLFCCVSCNTVARTARVFR